MVLHLGRFTFSQEQVRSRRDGQRIKSVYFLSWLRLLRCLWDQVQVNHHPLKGSVGITITCVHTHACPVQLKINIFLKIAWSVTFAARPNDSFKAWPLLALSFKLFKLLDYFWIFFLIPYPLDPQEHTYVQSWYTDFWQC